MISQRYAKFRYAQYYANLLLDADRLYQEGGINIERGLQLFDENWKNIENGQKWAALQSNVDEDFATLALEYPELALIAYTCGKNQLIELIGFKRHYTLPTHVSLGWSRGLFLVRSDWLWLRWVNIKRPLSTIQLGWN